MQKKSNNENTKKNITKKNFDKIIKEVYNDK